MNSSLNYGTNPSIVFVQSNNDSVKSSFSIEDVRFIVISRSENSLAAKSNFSGGVISEFSEML